MQSNAGGDRRWLPYAIDVGDQHAGVGHDAGRPVGAQLLVVRAGHLVDAVVNHRASSTSRPIAALWWGHHALAEQKQALTEVLARVVVPLRLAVRDQEVSASSRWRNTYAVPQGVPAGSISGSRMRTVLIGIVGATQRDQAVPSLITRLCCRRR